MWIGGKGWGCTLKLIQCIVKKERAEDLAKIVEAEKIKEKDRAIYGKKMTTMLAMIVDLNKPVCIRTPPSISRKRLSLRDKFSM